MIFYDIEGNGLKDEITTIWCISLKEDDGEIEHFGPDKIEEAVRRLHGQHICGHNSINYDNVVIQKFYPWFKPAKVEDTFVLSSLFEPDRKVGHSLESYGNQFKVRKPEHEDWTQYSDEMRVRNIMDVRITQRTWEHLCKERMSWDWEQAIALEYEIARVHAKQEANGVCFDVSAAEKLLEKIELEIALIEKTVIPQCPKIIKQWGTVPVNKPFLKSGEYTQAVKDWFEQELLLQPDLVGGPFTRFTMNDINLNSTVQVKDYLLSQGWVPTEWNFQLDAKGYPIKGPDGKPVKSSPKLTEDSFDSVQGDVPKLVARRSILLHRQRMIKNTRRDGEEVGFLNMLRPDGRITAGGVPQGTPTGRYRHTGVVNIPKAADGVVYGKEIRSLFKAKDGYLLLGTDAVALEARVEGHYCYTFTGGKEYAETLLQGDIHTKNATLFGCDRNTAKSVRYACSYGAQPPKLADTLKCSITKARRLHASFWENNTALSEFKESLTNSWKKRGGAKGGYLKGIDGRKLFARSEHSLVNLMFQSAGSIICKLASIYINKWIDQEGLDAKQVIFMHDELQFEVHPDDADRLLFLSKLAFKRAGMFFNTNIPIDGDAKVGLNWRDTH